MNPTIRSKIIFGVAAVIKKLHENKIIHRNLTNFNALLDDNSELQIGSFSFCRFLKKTEKMLSFGIKFFMAPEIYEENYSFHANI